MAESAKQREDDTSELIPRPDPTRLTTAALIREIAALRELLETQIDALDRLTKDRFETAERHRIEQKTDTKTMLDAALASQQAAVAKTEANFEKQISQLGTNAGTVNEGLRRSLDDLKGLLNDLKDRVTTIESTKLGAKEDRTGLYATLAAAGGLILLMFAVFGFMLTKIPVVR